LFINIIDKIFFYKKKIFKGFIIKLKGRFSKSSRSKISLNNKGEIAFSKIKNKLFFFEDLLYSRYGVASLKIYILINNNFFEKKKMIIKNLLKNF